ncbi:MAG: cupin domain-containing protein [Pseudomonadota bacterium]
MKINAEFDKRVIVHSEKLDWVPSPMKGVDRRPLDRVGDEVARATTIVRYAPGSHFSPHTHSGGEEFIVLDGVFQDEHGDYPAGSYIRNPPQSSHTPGSAPGCVIFVKLWQFEPEDRTHVRVRMDGNLKTEIVPGVIESLLYQDARERISFLELQAGTKVTLAADQGGEVLALNGSVQEGDDTLVKNSWLRTPVGSELSLEAGPEGAKLWIKTGQLADVDLQIERLNAA